MCHICDVLSVSRLGKSLNDYNPHVVILLFLPGCAVKGRE